MTTITTTPVNAVSGSVTFVGREWIVDTIPLWSGAVDAEDLEYNARNTGKTKTIRAWLGVQYAAHPVGANRWKTAVDYAHPAGTYQCATWPDVPYQSYVDENGSDGRPEWGNANGLYNWRGYGVKETEACATLNIWTPSGTPPVGGWPVIFWVHGGGWGVNSAIAYATRGHRQAAEGAIVVECDYPLSSFGHFYHPDMAGEAGYVSSSFAYSFIKSALRWVNTNIAAFGGNPAKLLISGTSAGGAATLALLEDTTMNGLYSAAWVSSGGGTGQRWGVNPGNRNVGIANRYRLFRDAILACADKIRDYSNPTRTVAQAIAVDGEFAAFRTALSPRHIMALADARDRINISRSMVATEAYEGTQNVYLFRDATWLTYDNSIEAARAGALTKVPTLILSSENEASLVDEASLNPWPYLNLLGVGDIDQWESLSWINPAWGSVEQNRIIYNHSIFQYPAWRIAKAIHETAGTSYLCLWNFSSTGTYSGHSTDRQYVFGNAQWAVSMVGSEARVTARTMRMADAMMRAMRNMAEHGNPNTPYVYADGFDLFAAPTVFSFGAYDTANPGFWNVIGKNARNAFDAPIEVRNENYFAGAWPSYQTRLEV